MPAQSARRDTPGFDITPYLERARPKRIPPRREPELLVLGMSRSPRDAAMAAHPGLPPGAVSADRARLAQALRELRVDLPDTGVIPHRRDAAPVLPGDASRFENVSPAVVLSGVDVFLKPRRPRDLPWEAFPVMAAPRHLLMHEDVFQAWAPDASEIALGATPVTLDEAAASARAILLLEGASGWSGAACAAVDLSRTIGADWSPLPVHVLDRTGALRTVRWSDCEAEEARCAGGRRLDYGYAMNFRALAGRALLQSLRDVPHVESPRRYMDELVRPAAVGMYDGLVTPVALQILYDMARFEDGGTARVAAVGDAPSWLDDSAGYDPESLVWTGTGRHPPRPLRALGANAAVGMLDEFGLAQPVDLAHFWNNCNRMPWSEALRVRPDGTRLFRITERGRAFLGLLHPDCEDPDLPLRWRDAEGRIGEEHIPAIDRCLTSMFRKLKKRVEHLPPR